MDLVEKYHSYNKLLRMMAENKCHGCVRLKEHLAWAKEQRRHKEELNALKFQLSDEALQQMPDFQGRVCPCCFYFLHYIILLWVTVTVAWSGSLTYFVHCDECDSYSKWCHFNPSSTVFSSLEEFGRLLLRCIHKLHYWKRQIYIIAIWPSSRFYDVTLSWSGYAGRIWYQSIESWCISSWL